MNTALNVLDAVFSLNFPWIAGFILQYPLWLFLFAAVAAILLDKKNWFWATTFLVFLVWSFGAFLEMVHWQFPGYLIALDVIATVALFAIEPSSPTVRKYFGPISTLRFLIPMTVLNLFVLAVGR